MTNGHDMPEELAALYLPQVEQLGMRLERSGCFWIGTARGSVADGSMWVTSPEPGCLVLYHSVVPRRDMVLQEESRGPYACACGMGGPALACSRVCGLPLRPVDGGHGAARSALATFVERGPRMLTSPLQAGQRYCSRSIIVLPAFFDELDRRYPGEFCNLLPVFDAPLGIGAARAVRRAMARIPDRPPTGSGGALRLRAAVDELAAALAMCRTYSGELCSGGRTPAGDLTLQACEIIEHALDRGEAPPSVERLAGMLHVSRSRLCAVFRQETGQAVGAYARRRRIERAQELLCDDDLAIAEVAARLGYRSTSAFDHAFAQVAGRSPRVWRDQRKGAWRRDL